ncbi:unnamed protein product [Effrenium voratum]|uniref:DUF4116 domain-containing protein n=1 Tax=Effrenium voratum TaxID=2562239 RepID=A0AA36MNB8_9DINO|nr:unnamed protein product [Effrenium voratum]|mmetsp:Transcript_101914/g.242957  ORF Transcript_101914/g.242957 Transcript_101914/m.242957 type:complete len:346 (-) Transcript_101914:108-1145(-)
MDGHLRPRRCKKLKVKASEIELTILGLPGALCVVKATPASLIREVKEEIRTQTGIEVDDQRLFAKDSAELSKDNAALSTVDLILDQPELPKAEVNLCNVLKASLLLLRRPPKQAEILAELSSVRGGEAVLKVFRDHGQDAAEDRIVVLESVRRNAQCLQHAAPHFLEDRQVVLTAAKQSGMILKLVSDELRKDREVVLAAVKQNCQAICLAAPELQEDREVMLMAVQKDRYNGEIFRNASPKLRGDREVVLAAVSAMGLNLQFADSALQSDLSIASAAVRQNPAALRLVDRSIRGHTKVLDAAGWNPPMPVIEGPIATKGAARWVAVLAVEPASQRTELYNRLIW